MRLLSAAALLLSVSPSTAFAPTTTRVSFVTNSRNVSPPVGKAPLFSTEEEIDYNSMTEEEEVAALVEEEMKKTVKVSKLKTKSGVDYAPWMNVSDDDAANIKQLMKEKAAARRRRELEEQSVSGNLYLDSQAQELSGTGLNYKFIDEAVELEWATKTEKNTAGFRVRRRQAKTEDFEIIGSYENFGPLVSKGPDGGIYRFLDDTVTPGGWVYRISEVDANGGEADLCQCLLEVQTKEEQVAGLVAGVGIAVFAVLVTAGAAFLDPYGGM